MSDEVVQRESLQLEEGVAVNGPNKCGEISVHVLWTTIMLPIENSSLTLRFELILQ